MTVSQTELGKALKEPAAYHNSPKTIKLRETSTSFLFKADDQLYKIKKSGNEYATLAVKEAFCKEGIMYFQHQRPNDKGVTIQTSFYGHDSELHTGWFFIPAENLSPQKFGAALTYARRYSLSTACGIGADDDDAESIQADYVAAQKTKKSNGQAPVVDWYTDVIDHLPDLNIKELDKVPSSLQKPIIKLVFESTPDKAEKARMAIKKIDGWKNHSLLLVNIKEAMDKTFEAQA